MNSSKKITKGMKFTAEKTISCAVMKSYELKKCAENKKDKEDTKAIKII